MSPRASPPLLQDPAPESSSPPALRVGLLPALAAEGAVAMPGWARLGLPALVAEAWAVWPALSLLRAERLQHALPSAAPGEPPGAFAQRALHACGLDRVLQIHWHQAGPRITLVGELSGADVSQQTAECEGDDGPSLAGALADALAGALAGALHERPMPGAAPASRPLSRDPLVLQAYARGVECFDQRSWHAAQLAFEVVLQAEPEAVAPRLWRLRCVVEQGLPQAVPLGQALRTLAGGGSPASLAAEVAALQQRACAAAPSEVERLAARPHGREAMAMARPHRLEPWALALRIEVGLCAAAGDSRDEALGWLDECEADAHSAASPWLLGLALQARGLLAFGHGDLAAAAGRLMQASQLQRGGAGALQLARTVGLLAAVRFEQGHLTEAAALCDEALTLSEGLPAAMRPTEVLALLALVHADAGSPVPMARLLAVIGPDDSAGPAPRAHRFAARAADALCRGDGDSAQRLLSVAAACLAATASLVAIGPCLVMLSRLALVAGDSAAAADLMPVEGSWLGLAAGPLSRGQLQHVQAAAAAAAGERTLALQRLAAIVAASPTGRQQVTATLDAAWLHIEVGDIESAEAALRDAGEWRQLHPSGLALAARCALARGNAAEAAALQQQALDRHTGVAPAAHLALLQAYGAGVATPPALPTLLSDSWLPVPGASAAG